MTFGTPNLFILGAAKSGTTSLYHGLSRHPEIQVSRIKEPSFFCSYFQDIKNPIAYFSLFDDSYKWRVDASHVYLSNPESPQIISRLFPNARFIIILRDPIRRAYALYRHMRRHNHFDGQPYELIADFTSALQAEDDRYHSDQFWTDCRQYPWNFFYWRSSVYDEQIDRYLSHFSRKQFLILSLADLATDPLSVIHKISDFTNIDPSSFSQSDTWHFNADPFDHEMPSCSLDFLSQRLDGVQMRTENLLDVSLNFTI